VQLQLITHNTPIQHYKHRGYTCRLSRVHLPSLTQHTCNALLLLWCLTRWPPALHHPPACCCCCQVEHGITEMVNGNVDIVEWMLRLQLPHFLAPLHFDTLEKELKRTGWSIEVRPINRRGTEQHTQTHML